MNRAFVFGLAFAVLLGGGSATAHAAEYGATYTLGAAPKLCSNLSATITVTLTNTGARTWTAGGAAPFRLAYHVYQGSALVTWEGLSASCRPMTSPRSERDRQRRAQGTLRPRLLHAEVGPGARDRDLVLLAGRGDRGSGSGSPAAYSASPTRLRSQPRITSTNTTVSPGDVVLVWGHLFGQGGTITLQGDFAGKSDIPLTTLVWQDDIIGALVPDDISGVLDQAATIRVTRGDGASAGRDVRFLAARQIRGLWSREVQTACSDAAWRNRCNGVGDSPLNAAASTSRAWRRWWPAIRTGMGSETTPSTRSSSISRTGGSSTRASGVAT